MSSGSFTLPPRGLGNNMASPAQIQVVGPGYPNGLATLRQLLDGELGATVGQFAFRATTGWGVISAPHFAVIPLVGVASTSGGGIAAYIPKEGLPIIVTRTTLYVITKSTGAATVDVGVGTNATTDSGNLITACDVGSNSAVVYDNITDVGASGKSRQLCSGAQYVTVTGLASTVGMVATLYLEFIKI